MDQKKSDKGLFNVHILRGVYLYFIIGRFITGAVISKERVEGAISGNGGLGWIAVDYS